MPTLEVIINPSGAVRGARLVDDSLDRIDRAARRTARTVGTVDQRLDRFGRNAGRIGRQLTTLFAGISAGVAFRGIFRTLAGFERQISVLQAITQQTDTTGEGLQRLRQRSLELGEATEFTATQAAQALTKLIRAGLTTQEALEAVNSTLNLALVGELSFAQAADIAATSVRQFGLDTTDTERIVDLFVNTANTSNTTIQQLANAFKFSGPVFAAVGVSIEDAAAAASLLADAGIRSTLSGTNLRRVLTNLSAPTRNVETAIEGLGLNIEDVNIRTIGFVEALNNLARTDILQEPGALRDIFGQRAIAGGTVLVRLAPQLKELVEINQELAGVAQRAADTVTQNLLGALRRLVSTIQDVILQGGDQGLLGILTRFIVELRIAIRFIFLAEGAFSELSGTAKVLVGVIETLGIFLGLAAATKGIAILKSLIGTVDQATTGFIALRTAFIILAGFNFGRLLAQTQDFGIVSVLIVKQINFLIEDIKTLFSLSRRFFTELSTILQEIDRRFRELVNNFVNAFSDSIPDAIEAFVRAVNQNISLSSLFPPTLLARVVGDVAGEERTAEQILSERARRRAGFEEAAERSILRLRGGDPDAPTPGSAAARAAAERERVRAQQEANERERELRERAQRIRNEIAKVSAEINNEFERAQATALTQQDIFRLGAQLEEQFATPIERAANNLALLNRLAEIKDAIDPVTLERAIRNEIETLRFGEPLSEAVERLRVDDPFIILRENLRVLKAALDEGDISLKDYDRSVQAVRESYLVATGQADRFLGKLTELDLVVQRANARFRVQQRTIEAGASLALVEYGRRVENAGIITRDIAVTGLNGLTDSLVDIITFSKSAGEAFKEFGRVIVRELARIGTQLIILGIIQSIVGIFVGGRTNTLQSALGANNVGGLGAGTIGSLVRSESTPTGTLGLRGGSSNVPSFQTGGIAIGPESGFLALLHGIEEIRPLDRGTRRPLNENRSQPDTVINNFNTVNINAIDAKSADETVLESLARNTEVFATSVANESARIKTLGDRIRGRR